MKRNVFVFGSISGLILATYMVISTALCSDNPNFETSMFVGYAGMILAFSFVFVGIKNFRDKYNDGLITFGKAFKLGLYITLVTSTVYVIVWLIEYYCFIPDFMDKYAEHEISKARSGGLTQAELDLQIQKILKMKEMYKNPLFVILITYMEILPIGLLISIISALILKRKSKGKDILTA
jgi:hypothetical protein